MWSKCCKFCQVWSTRRIRTSVYYPSSAITTMPRRMRFPIVIAHSTTLYTKCGRNGLEVLIWLAEKWICYCWRKEVRVKLSEVINSNYLIRVFFLLILYGNDFTTKYWSLLCICSMHVMFVSMYEYLSFHVIFSKWNEVNCKSWQHHFQLVITIHNNLHAIYKAEEVKAVVLLEVSLL